MELLAYLIWLFIVGLLIGALGRLLVPGPQPIGILATALIGIGGAFLAGLATRYVISPREDWVGIVLAVLFAAVLVWAFAGRGRAVRY